MLRCVGCGRDVTTEHGVRLEARPGERTQTDLAVYTKDKNEPLSIVYYCTEQCLRKTLSEKFSKLFPDSEALNKFLEGRLRPLTELNHKTIKHLTERQRIFEQGIKLADGQMKATVFGSLCSKYDLSPYLGNYILAELSHTGDVEFTTSLIQAFVAELRLFAIANEIVIEAAVSVTNYESKLLKLYREPSLDQEEKPKKKKPKPKVTLDAFFTDLPMEKDRSIFREEQEDESES